MDYKKRIDIAFNGSQEDYIKLNITKGLERDSIDYGKLTEKDGLLYNDEAIEYLISELYIYCDGDLSECRSVIDGLKKSYSVYIKKEQYKRPMAEAWLIKEAQFMEMVDSMECLYFADRAKEPHRKEQQVEPHQGSLNERAEKYFERAINEGWAEKTCYGYKWKIEKIKLAYIVQEIYNPNGSGRIPYKELEAIFGMDRLDSSVTQLITAKKPQKWIPEIDKKIFFD